MSHKKKHHHEEYYERPPKNWGNSREFVISLAVLMVTTLGTTIPLYLQSCSQIEAIRNDVKSIQSEMHTMHAEIRADMRDFHGRLISLEERYKGFPTSR